VPYYFFPTPIKNPRDCESHLFDLELRLKYVLTLYGKTFKGMSEAKEWDLVDYVSLFICFNTSSFSPCGAGD
jgi:hypothetical protein